MYKHIKTGKFYQLLEDCKIQIDDIWVQAVIYQNFYGLKFVRTKEEFNEKFVKLTNQEINQIDDIIDW